MGTPIRRLRAVSLAEGVSYLALLGIAMPLKYLADSPEAVQALGALHGLLTVLFLGAVVHVWIARRWPVVRVLVALVASVIPFGAFALEARLRREDSAGLAHPDAPTLS